MGKEPNRIAAADHDPTPQDVRRLEREIEQSRRRLSDVVAELDRRRHNLLSPGHPAGIAVLAAAGSAILGGAAFLAARAVRRKRLRKRARGLAGALTRAYKHPERVASDGKGSLTKIAVAALPVLLKVVADRALERRAGRSSGRQ